MVTKAGWRLAAIGIVAALGGRAAGVDELIVLGLTGPAVVILSRLWLSWLRVQLAVSRVVQPMRAHAGSPATATISVRSGKRGCPVVQVTDSVTATGGISFRAGPFRPSELAQVSYKLPTTRRGRLAIGPAELTLTDPLGLTTTKLLGGEASELIVYPQIVRLAPVSFAPGGRSRHGASESHSVRRLGEDFYALRDYTAGDDPRRIHWRSTARLGRPMVREDENPRVHRVGVLLDTRAAAYAYDQDRFEVAVTAVASVAAACALRHDVINLVTTTGDELSAGGAPRSVTPLFDFLAEVALSERGNLRSGLTQLAMADASALVAVVGGNDVNTDAQLELTASLAEVQTSVSVVRIGDGGDPEMVRRGQFKLIGVSTVDQFSGVWNAAQQSHGTGGISMAPASSRLTQ